MVTSEPSKGHNNKYKDFGGLSTEIPFICSDRTVSVVLALYWRNFVIYLMLILCWSVRRLVPYVFLKSVASPPNAICCSNSFFFSFHWLVLFTLLRVVCVNQIFVPFFFSLCRSQFSLWLTWSDCECVYVCCECRQNQKRNDFIASYQAVTWQRIHYKLVGTHKYIIEY